MQAFISDLHGNQEALNSVLEHMEGLGVSRVFCLGDIIGYGPNPCECLDRAQSFDYCLKGNHEASLVDYAGDFNPQARKALNWTRDSILGACPTQAAEKERWEWLNNLPEAAYEFQFMCVHGSPRDPLREYVMPQDIYNSHKMIDLFANMERSICFVGHSHVPGIYTEDMNYYPQKDLENGFIPGEGKVLVNIGSVGQPRDGDRRACYVTWDGKRLRFHRVEYDFRITMDKILQTHGKLPDMLAFRLEEGR
ncbi:MAG: metallophosphoesterase family protein [Planctomycetota bacterium]